MVRLIFTQRNKHATSPDKKTIFPIPSYVDIKNEDLNMWKEHLNKNNYTEYQIILKEDDTEVKNNIVFTKNTDIPQRPSKGSNND